MVTYQYHYRELDTLPASDQPRRAALWLPTEWLAVHSVERPTMAEKKWRPLLGYLLEERLAEPVDQLHFALVGGDANTVDVAVVARSVVEAVVEKAVSCGIDCVALVPDFYALPWDGATAQLSINEGRWLLRLGEQRGFAGGADLAEPLLCEWLAQHPEAKVAIANPAEQPLPTEIIDRATAASGAVNWQFAALPAVNLLQGSYQPKTVHRWRARAITALPVLLWSLLLVAALGVYLAVVASVNQRDSADLTRYRSYLADQLVARGSQLPAVELNAVVRRDTARLYQVEALRRAPHYQLATQLDTLLASSGARVEALSWRGDEVTLTARGDPRELAALRRGLMATPQALLVALDLNEESSGGGSLIATLRREVAR